MALTDFDTLVFKHFDESALGPRDWAFIRARARGNNHLTCALLAGFERESARAEIDRLLSMDVVQQKIAELRLQAHYAALEDDTVLARSTLNNIYYCCTQKTASQWLRPVLESPIFYRYTGLKVLPFIQQGLRYAVIEHPYPAGTIATHLYIDYPTYAEIKKQAPYRTFFVLRDPRDIVVSWYYSARYSHPRVGPIPQMRKALQQLDVKDGLRYIIDLLDAWGTFTAQRSWLSAAPGDPHVRIFRYEQLAQSPETFLLDLFEYLKVDMPAPVFAKLLADARFEKFSGGRLQGEADRASHFRKGIAGDWQEHFDLELLDYFYSKTEELVALAGY